MTTTFLDNKMFTFIFFVVVASDEKTAFWGLPTKKQHFGRFSSLPPGTPPSKTSIFIFIVVLPSLKLSLAILR